MESLKKQTWIKLIHTARRQLGLDDAEYKAILLGAAGIESSKELSSETQFDEIMKALRNLGFRYQKREEIILPNRASKAQIAYIKRLWDLGSRSKTESSLRQFLRRVGHVDDVNFLTKQQASAVILALEDINMKAREAE